jgi:hypothetical protein
MKAPLLLGNDIRKMDKVALGVVMNKDALAISQDALGVQAQRVWVSGNNGVGSSLDQLDLNPAVGSAAAVAARCDPSRSTQAWKEVDGVLSTTDSQGVEWCMRDVHGTEEVGSWMGVACTTASPLSAGVVATPLTFKQQQMHGNNSNNNSGNLIQAGTLTTPLGGQLAVNNAEGASGPVPHTRYLSTTQSRSFSANSTWLRKRVGGNGVPTADGLFSLMATDRVGMRDDDKVGGVTRGGDFCLDLVQDADSEVWAGPLADKKWAVALLNRNANAPAKITLNYTMLNTTAGASFAVKDVWEGQDVGTFKGAFTATVQSQSVAYLVLTPA